MFKRILAVSAILTASLLLALPLTALEPDTEKALSSALDDEWRSQAFYRAVLEQYGDVRPFAHIVEAEGRHASHLLDLFHRYDLDVPENRWQAHDFGVTGSLAEVCAQAAKSEIDNVALYDGFLDAIPSGDVRDLMVHLRAMSQEHHLPAFQRCAEGGAGRGPGMGGRGKGMGGHGPGMGGRGKGSMARGAGGCCAGCGRGDSESQDGCGRCARRSGAR